MGLSRKYNKPDANLIMLAINLISSMKRDASLFAGRGVSAGDISAFEALVNNFKNILSDTYYHALIYGIAKSKKEARNRALASVIFISGYFEQKWGRESSEYKLLRIKGVSGMTDNNFLIACYNVVTAASDNLSILSAIGLTQSDIDTLDSNAHDFEDEMNLLAQNKAIRSQKANERTQAANELYSNIKMYSSLGKIIWYDVNYARYKDYLIYQNDHKSRPADAETLS